MPTTHTLSTAQAEIVYDVHGPLPSEDGRPPILMIGQPMTAAGFSALIAELPDRTAVTYDPRGLGRSARSDGRTDQTPQQQAADVHAVIEALDTGPVEVFASSGGAVTALELATAYPDSVTTVVAHEPPLIMIVPDAEAAQRARAQVRDVYEARGENAGMAAFMVMTSWQGEYDETYFAQPPVDPAAFGMPADDDGTRDSPLLSDSSWAISGYRPDAAALKAGPARIVVAIGEESAGTFTDRSARALADLLDSAPAIFPSHHGGFLGPEFGYPGRPAEFAVRLTDVLDGGA